MRFRTADNVRMRTLVCLLVLLLPAAATADVWMWKDSLGNVHYVESNRQIYTWLDDGKVFYADAPDHEDAVAVVLVWHSKGRLEDVLETSDSRPETVPETPEQKAEREAAEAKYCQRTTEIYDAYVNAPKLYRSTEDGKREYLDKKEANATIAETRAALDKHCN